MALLESEPMSVETKDEISVALAGTWSTSGVMVPEAPTSFSLFSLVDCMLLSHFSCNDFVAIAFLDLAEDLDTQI